MSVSDLQCSFGLVASFKNHRYVRSSDGPHDLTIPHFWLSDGLKGADFAADCALKHVDLMTIHIYPGAKHGPFTG
jgi:hypothetical protein